jgi:hypothetical protein
MTDTFKPLTGIRKPFTPQEAHDLWVNAYFEGMPPSVIEFIKALAELDTIRMEDRHYGFFGADCLAAFLNYALTESIR